ncbi:MAG: carbohydrate ABC transporter permease, partial [Devosia sp.]|nr:carbohydrate ABC transporter permease [Devosia sp.]
MARRVSTSTKVGFTVLAWAVALLLFSPILWTVLTAFKTEAEAIASQPTFFPQNFTLENFGAVQDRSDYFKHAINSIMVSFGSTILGLIIAIPAAWSMAFAPSKRTKDILMWMLSTKMMPAVGVLIPIYLIF